MALGFKRCSAQAPHALLAWSRCKQGVSKFFRGAADGVWIAATPLVFTWSVNAWLFHNPPLV